MTTIDIDTLIESAREAGAAYAAAAIESGQNEPGEPLSGEWADGLTEHDVLAPLGAAHLIEGEQDERIYVIDAWLEGYERAAWPFTTPTESWGGIIGYLYCAQAYTPDQLHAAYVERWIEGGACSPGARDMGMESILDQRAAAEGIDRDDEYSFDSDDFPKVILYGQN